MFRLDHRAWATSTLQSPSQAGRQLSSHRASVQAEPAPRTERPKHRDDVKTVSSAERWQS
jgi:hypothetical protein